MWALGALLSVLGGIGTNLGVNMQKYSFMLDAKRSSEQQRPYYKQTRWLIGLSLVVLGSLGDFTALSMAAESIVAPLGSITLVSNIFFAHYWLRERLTRNDIIGTSAIIFGSILSVMFGDHSSRTYTIDNLIHFYGHSMFIAFAIVCATAATVAFIFIRKVNPIKSRYIDNIKLEDDLRSMPPEKLDENCLEAQELLLDAIEAEYRPYEKLHPLVLCSLSGLFGGFSVLFGKSVSELLSTTFQGNIQVDSPFFWVVLVCMCICIVSQLRTLAMALRWFDALYCIPVFQCFWITTSTLGGAFYFDEFKGFSAVQYIFFPVGIFITIVGVYILTLRKMSGRDDTRPSSENTTYPVDYADSNIFNSPDVNASSSLDAKFNATPLPDEHDVYHDVDFDVEANVAELQFIKRQEAAVLQQATQRIAEIRSAPVTGNESISKLRYQELIVKPFEDVSTEETIEIVS